MGQFINITNTTILTPLLNHAYNTIVMNQIPLIYYTKSHSKSKLKTPTPQEHGILAAATSSLSAVVRERGDSVGSESVSPLINQTPSDKKRRTNSDTAGGDSADPQEMERRRSFLERNRQGKKSR